MIRLLSSALSVLILILLIKSCAYRICPTYGGGEGYYLKSNKKSRAIMMNDSDVPHHNTNEFAKIDEIGFKSPTKSPLSTLSIDVDNAAYTIARSSISNGYMPDKGSVRIEEYINYFDYNYPDAKGEHPFYMHSEVAQSPWNPEHKIVQIGIQGKKLDTKNLKASNLVFLLDVSGSMSDANKLPLLKKSLKILLDGMTKEDRIAIVAYAGAAGLVLPSTPATERKTIEDALERLSAGGSTAGGQGIQLAYQIAKDNFIEGGNNRVILGTDGDFNVGTSSTSALVELVEKKREEGVFLTIAGFGMGNYKDGRMEEISNKGNGNYFYIDNIREANKVFSDDLRANMFTIAKDVKIQVEFNPSLVQAYRLIGYENRMLNDEDFNDDTKDAGELGAGHTVTALYEIIPVGVKSDYLQKVDDLKYQTTTTTVDANSSEMMTVKFRYKKPDEDTSKLIVHTIKNNSEKIENASERFRFATAVAEFGLLLRDSKFKGQANYTHVIAQAKAALGQDEDGYRAEFVNMVKSARLLAKK